MRPNPNAVSTVTPRTDRSRALLVLAGLVMPGGVLLLAWLLCRRFLTRAGAQAVKRLVRTLVMAVLVQGCATQIGTPREASHEDGTAIATPVLQFQNPSAEPADRDAFVGADTLRPGDILLTSMPGLAAAGIELMTVAPVSHTAVYIGDGRVVEAVREGVRERHIDAVIAEESVALVLRYPDLSEAQARRIRQYAQHKIGAGFNFFGVTVQIPYSIGRRVCELPLVPPAVRDACIRAMGVFSQLAATERQLFCSQLVLQAFRHAGVPLTDADPRIMSPADILHMRDGDVPSVRIRKPLHYVGHLKYDAPQVATLER
jgi:uncharacterized protein YycO